MNRAVLNFQCIGNFISIFHHFGFTKTQFIYSFTGIIDNGSF